MTSLSEIYDLLLMLITDYRLIALYETSVADFEAYLEAWLIYAIQEFSMCDQDLTYNSTSKLFTVTLTEQNKTVLAKLMVKYWLKKLVNDVTQINLHITDRDFKIASEAMNLREKSAHLITVTEECSQLLNDYEYGKEDWTQWLDQNFMEG